MYGAWYKCASFFFSSGVKAFCFANLPTINSIKGDFYEVSLEFSKDAFEICIFSSTLGWTLLTLMMRRKRRKMECNAQFVYSNYQQKQVRKINCGFLSVLIFTILHFHIPLGKNFTILQASTTLQELCFLFLSKIANQQQ